MGGQHTKNVLVLRWIALGLANLTGVWWLWTLGRHLVAACLAGVGLAWWRARLGGLVLVLAGAALCGFAYASAGSNKWVAVLVSGVPFLVGGVMLL